MLLWLGCGRVGFGWGDDPEISPIDPSPWPGDDSPQDPGDGSDEPDAAVDPPVVPPQPPSDAGTPSPTDAGGGGPSQDGGNQPPSDGGPWPWPPGDGGTWPWPPHDGGTHPGDGGRPHGGGGSRGCDGKCVDDLCWYLGDPGESCEDACRKHGGPDRRAAKRVGTAAQGGSAEKCAQILRALGVSKKVSTGSRSDGLGLGCHRWSDGATWWLNDPVFDAAAQTSPAERVCACED